MLINACVIKLNWTFNGLKSWVTYLFNFIDTFLWIPEFELHCLSWWCPVSAFLLCFSSVFIWLGDWSWLCWISAKIWFCCNMWISWPWSSVKLWNLAILFNVVMKHEVLMFSICSYAISCTNLHSQALHLIQSWD